MRSVVYILVNTNDSLFVSRIALFSYWYWFDSKFLVSVISAVFEALLSIVSFS